MANRINKYLDGAGLTYLIQKIKTALGSKQDTLVSGTNIKTVNGQSLVGSGNVAIQIPPAPPEPLLVYMAESGGTYSLNQELLDIEDALSNNDELECYLVWDGDQPAVVRLRCYGYNVEETIGGHSQSCIVWSGLDNIGNRHIVKAYHDSTNDVDVVNYSVASSDGKGITNIVKTATVGLVDTYTITYSDGTTSTYTVTNGKDGQNGRDGQDGQDGADGVSLGEVALVQTTGDDEESVMSQKAVTDAINYNINIEHGEGFTPNSNTNLIYLKLTTKATSLLNASDKMTFMFSTKGTGGNQDYRYFQFGNANLANNLMDYNGACLVWSFSRNLSANAVSYTLNESGSNRPTPDVWIVTWDRINGVVRFYDHTTLVNTLEGDSYKKDRFVNDNGVIAMRGGDNNARIYDIRLFDFDLSYLFAYSDVGNEINYLCGAGILPSQFLDNYKKANSDSSFFSEINAFLGGGYDATCTYTLDGDDYHIIVKDGTTTSQICGGKPFYTGWVNRAQITKLDIEVVSGIIKLAWRNNFQDEFTNMHIILDENGNEISDYNNIGVGKYTYIKTYAAAGAPFDFYKVSGDVEVIINRNIQYKPISCVFHLRGDTMYNKKFYDDQTKEFITFYSNRTCSTEYAKHTMIKTPQRVIRNNISSHNGLPHYPGEMAVVGDKVYVGMADYTWKQINNS